MKSVLKKMKDKMFFKLVEKNQNILEEYQDYKWSVEGKENKLRSWSYIALLNYKYRVLKIDINHKINHTGTNRQRHSKKKRKFPYTLGPESEVFNRLAPEQLAKQLMTYGIISFDIFDTLLLRPFSRPHHLFMLLAEKHDYVGFMTVRIQAEREARERALIENGNREVTIHDIYEIVERKTGISKEIGIKYELETELDFCFANPYMLEVYKILRSQGKKLIAITDMYLPEEMIQSLLRRNQYFIDDVFVSCEWNGSKRDKNLYKVVLNRLSYSLKSNKMIHIGDNYQTDIINARELGIDAKYYKKVHDIGDQYRAPGMSDLIGSVYSGIINTHIHNGKSQFSIPYEYGFIYGGIYVLGYCNWIYEYTVNNNIDKVIFLSRDGDIYKRVFDYLYTDVENEYVYWSRIANMKYTLENNREDFLKRIVRQKAANAIEGSMENTIDSLLKSLEINELYEKLMSYGLRKDEVIHNGNVTLLEQLFIDNWDTVILHFAKEEKLIKRYLMNVIGSSKKLAVVDVGWLGSGGMGLKYLIEEKWGLGCEVHSLVAASWRKNHAMNIHKLLNKDTQAYMFSRIFNRNLYSKHNSNKGLNSVFFELFTQAEHPSFAGLKKTDDGDDYKFMFDVPEIENYKIIKQIHKGILDFIYLYEKISRNTPLLRNIPGSDAYTPFSFIANDVSYFRNFFGDMLFSRGVLANQEKQSMESLKYILDKSKL